MRNIVLSRRQRSALDTAAAVTAVTAAMCWAPGALAGNRITTEAVDDYSACNGGSLANSLADANGFRSKMLAPGSIFSPGVKWENGDVWRSDFLDPQKFSGGEDSSNFDRSGDAIAYFAGHGVCGWNGAPNQGLSGQFCTKTAQCSSPPAGTTGPGVCWRRPGDGFGQCAYRTQRALAVGNCSSPSPNNGIANYSNGTVAFGESATSTGWAGAGTNGGVNLVVLHSSCALLSAREAEVFPAFAGAHMMAFTVVHTGDTANVADRGSSFGARYLANPNGSVATAWADAMNSINHSNDWCRNAANNKAYGGGRGFNGCGSHEMLSLDTTVAGAQGHLNENWSALKNDAADAKGSGAWAIRFTCNWDCKTWTPYL